MKLDFEQLASEIVSDGETPNVYFLTDNTGRVLALVTTTQADAVRVAEAIGAYLVEDRMTGVVWGSEEFNRLHACEADE